MICTKEELWQLNYSIQFHETLLEQERGFLQQAQEQLKQHHQELNYRKKADRARQYIDYLAREIPEIEATIALLEQYIEMMKRQVAGHSISEAERELDAMNRQLTIDDLICPA
jgi:predicted RNase H-like nuclease (RuvC/YqgF family)